MKNNEKTIVFRLMNPNSPKMHAQFDKFTLSEYNQKFDTKYKSVQEAVEDDPEYLYTEDEVNEAKFQKKCEVRRLPRSVNMHKALN